VVVEEGGRVRDVRMRKPMLEKDKRVTISENNKKNTKKIVTNRSRRRGMIVNREKDSSDFLVPENILSIS
jgi:hypothetical protein